MDYRGPWPTTRQKHGRSSSTTSRSRPTTSASRSARSARPTSSLDDVTRRPARGGAVPSGAARLRAGEADAHRVRPAGRHPGPDLRAARARTPVAGRQAASSTRPSRRRRGPTTAWARCRTRCGRSTSGDAELRAGLSEVRAPHRRRPGPRRGTSRASRSLALGPWRGARGGGTRTAARGGRADPRGRAGRRRRYRPRHGDRLGMAVQCGAPRRGSVGSGPPASAAARRGAGGETTRSGTRTAGAARGPGRGRRARACRTGRVSDRS